MENWPYTKNNMNIIIKHVYLIYKIINLTVKNILLYLINLAQLIQHKKITDILSTLTEWRHSGQWWNIYSSFILMLYFRPAVHIVYHATSTINMGGDKERALVVRNQLIPLLWSAVHLLGQSEPGQ